MTLISVMSAFSLSVLLAICVAGVFSPRFKDTWLQFFGLCGVTLWCAARLWDVLHGAPVSTQQLLAHVSLMLYAAGTALKVWRPPK